jgi:hypothetical protein
MTTHLAVLDPDLLPLPELAGVYLEFCPLSAKWTLDFNAHALPVTR